MRPGESRREFERGARWTRRTDCNDRDRFTVRRCANGQLFTDSETVHAADLDVGRARARISRQIRAARRCTDARYRHRLNPMADAVDVQPDLVTYGNVGHGRDLDVTRAGGSVLA